MFPKEFMEDFGKMIRRTLIGVSILLGGCSLTATPFGKDAPVFPMDSARPVVPWTYSPDSSDVEPSNSTSDSSGSAFPFVIDPKTVDPFVAESKAEPAVETFAEKSETKITAETLETVLSRDLWYRNLVLERWQDNGMKDPNPKQDPEKLKRLAEINRLNMSAKERRKSADPPEFLTGLPSTWRWFHKEIEEISRISVSKRPDPVFFLEKAKYQGDEHRILRANAVILMARDGDQTMGPNLLKIVADADYRLELRCTAAEILGRLDSVAASDLISMLERVREKTVETVDPQTGLSRQETVKGNPELWVELLAALAVKIPASEHPCFLDALWAQNGRVRLETIKIWRRNPVSETNLPDKFLQYARKEADPTIRMEIAKTLGVWKEPRILEIVRNDLNQSAALRNVAIDALAEANCREAIPFIQDKLRDSIGKNRAQAVSALRKLACLDDVFRMSEDKAVEVRIEVAKALTDRLTPQSVQLARKYLTDHEKVRRETLDAIAHWPLEDGAPILLDALTNNLESIRIQAAEILARSFPAAGKYDVSADPKSQAERHAELVESFNATLGATFNTAENGHSKGKTALRQRRQTVPDDRLIADVRRCLEDWNRPGTTKNERQILRARLTGLGDRLPTILDYLYVEEKRSIPDSLDPVLAEVDPFYDVVFRLGAPGATERRRAATEFVRWSRTRELERLACRRVLEYALREHDPTIQSALLEGLHHADGISARRFAQTLLDSPSPDLKRRACETLREFGNVRDLESLLETMQDSSRAVVRSALEAIVEILLDLDEASFQRERQLVLNVFHSTLLRNDPYLQADVAVALHALGETEGEETLGRLSFSSDSRVRLYVAQAVVSLEDSVFVPLLIRFLDDNGSIRQIALAGLPKLAGRDIGLSDSDESFSRETSTTQKKIARWKRWSETGE